MLIPLRGARRSASSRWLRRSVLDATLRGRRSRLVAKPTDPAQLPAVNGEHRLALFTLYPRIGGWEMARPGEHLRATDAAGDLPVLRVQVPRNEQRPKLFAAV